jgi:hypothetical protein
MVERFDVVIALPIQDGLEILDECLPAFLNKAAELLTTDLELSTTDKWQPVLRVAGTTLRCTAALIGHINRSVITTGSRQLFYNLFDVISLICNILSQDCPTILGLMRFLKRLMEAANDISQSLGIAGPGVVLEEAHTIKLWLETIGNELQTVLSLLRADTLVFTCPFPLAGCTYQTTDMQQWTSHMNICRGQQLVSRRFLPVETRACKELDLRDAKHALAVATLKIADLNGTIARHSGPIRHLHRFTLQLFGLCILSVPPLRTNMLGFVVCWLAILRSVNMWKCRNRLVILDLISSHRGLKGWG